MSPAKLQIGDNRARGGEAMAGPYYNSYMPQLPQQMQNQYPVQMPQYMPGYMQQMQSQYPMQAGIQARYVTGREEAVAAQIPQDGNMCIFADTGHGMIYTKQLNMQDGSAVFRAYRQVDAQRPEQTAEDAPTDEYVKRSEFDGVKGGLDKLRGDFNELMRQLTTPTPHGKKGDGE